jgi:hypothetical protein
MVTIQAIWLAAFLALLSSGIYNSTNHSGSQQQQYYNYTHPGMGYNYNFKRR